MEASPNIGSGNMGSILPCFTKYPPPFVPRYTRTRNQQPHNVRWLPNSSNPPSPMYLKIPHIPPQKTPFSDSTRIWKQRRGEFAFSEHRCRRTCSTRNSTFDKAGRRRWYCCFPGWFSKQCHYRFLPVGPCKEDWKGRWKDWRNQNSGNRANTPNEEHLVLKHFKRPYLS